MSSGLIEYLRLLDKAVCDETFNQMVRQRIDLQIQSDTLSSLLGENRVMARSIPNTEPIWVVYQNEFLTIIRQQRHITRASCDLDEAISYWMDHAPPEVQPLIRTVKSQLGLFNG